MSDIEREDGRDRAELLQRVELMEQMIAEGRSTIMRGGWIFVLWGLVDLVGYEWERFAPAALVGRWTWPVCLAIGAAITVLGRVLQNRRPGYRRSKQCSSIEAVWAVMGVAIVLYVGTAIATHFAWQFSYVAALMMMVGMAHGISAAILRWWAQGATAAIWWAGGVSIFLFNSHRATDDIFLLEMCFGMIAFGLYVMVMERRRKNA